MPREKTQLLKSLEKKHNILDKEIEQLYKHTNAELSLKQLKKQKLVLKQQIESIRKELHDG
jgi:hypothetical protein